MKKEDFLGLFVYAGMIIISIFIGLRIIQPAFGAMPLSVGEQYLFAIVSILAGFLINVILAEVGHVVGARLGGYAILSVNVLGLCMFKSQGKWKVGIRPYEGLTGETRITPRRPNAKPQLNLWSGLIIYLIEFAIGMVLYLVIPSDIPLRYAAVIVISVGGMLMFYNVMPFKLDTMTDGYRLALISKGVNVEAYNELMRINMDISDGKKPENIKSFSEITTLTAQVNLYRVYEFLGQHKFAEAEEVLDLILAKPEKLNEMTNSRVMSQKIFVVLMTKPHDEAAKFYEEKLDSRAKHFLSADSSLESLRAYLLVAGLLEDSRSECVYVIERKSKAIKRGGEVNRKEVEAMLFDEALEKVKSQHPDWEWPSE